MNNSAFWKFFETDAYPNLEHRQQSLRCVFEYLDHLAGPVFVVETGVCVMRQWLTSSVPTWMAGPSGSAWEPEQDDR
jgi:hypothetical protein